MRFRFHQRVNGKAHYVLQSWADYRLPHSAQYMWGVLGLPAADMAETVYQDGKIIGFFRYRLHGNNLEALGTWVSNKSRRTGLARELWQRVLKRHRPKKIHATVATLAGLRFIRNLERTKTFGLAELHVFDNTP